MSARPSTRSGHPGRAAAAQAASAARERPTARRWWAVLPLAALVAIVALAVVVLPGGADESEGGGSGATSAEEEAARLRDEFAARDVAQIEALTETARGAAERLGALVDEMGVLLPPGAPPETRSPADPATVARWSRQVEDVTTLFGDPESAGTQVNVARGALVAAVDAVRLAVTSYRDALRLPAGEDRTAALARASEALDLGVRTWSTAATQLDVANVDAGLGHQHVNLSGTAAPDSQPEGSDAE